MTYMQQEPSLREMFPKESFRAYEGRGDIDTERSGIITKTCAIDEV